MCKPSELSPLTAHALAEVMMEAQLPPGVVNIVFGYGAEAGQSLYVARRFLLNDWFGFHKCVSLSSVSHPDVNMVSFTGGTKTGQIVAAAAATTFKKLSLELGGKNASIVFADCDFDKTVEQTVRAAFLNSGQICLCGSRVFVEREIYDRFSQVHIS